MLPYITFEWVWDIGHYVFQGGLFFALSVIGIGMTFCIIKSVMDTMKGQDGGGQEH